MGPTEVFVIIITLLAFVVGIGAIVLGLAEEEVGSLGIGVLLLLCVVALFMVDADAFEEGDTGSYSDAKNPYGGVNKVAYYDDFSGYDILTVFDNNGVAKCSFRVDADLPESSWDKRGCGDDVGVFVKEDA